MADSAHIVLHCYRHHPYLVLHFTVRKKVAAVLNLKSKQPEGPCLIVAGIPATRLLALHRYRHHRYIVLTTYPHQ
jgi:hypothetical protein